MRPLSKWPVEMRQRITGVFTDIDDTLTTAGAITPDALEALANLQAAGLRVIAITGRPVGWCEALMQINPILGTIVAENGSVALIKDKNGNPVSSIGHSLLSKLYQQDDLTRCQNAQRMQQVAAQVLREVPEAALSRDGGGRETDLAFDYNEHLQLPPATVQRILAILQREGMHTTVSSIHIHGCFGEFDKWRGACWLARELWGLDLATALDEWLFVGDSGNDQAMFQHFTHSVGVANIGRFLPQLAFKPTYVAEGARGAGFAEVARAVLSASPRGEDPGRQKDRAAWR